MAGAHGGPGFFWGRTVINGDGSEIAAGEPMVGVYRGGLLESVHFGHVVVADARGRIESSLGNPDTPTFLRSCAKPLQALPVVETGAADRFGFSTRECTFTLSASIQPNHPPSILVLSTQPCSVLPTGARPGSSCLVSISSGVTAQFLTRTILECYT